MPFPFSIKYSMLLTKHHAQSDLEIALNYIKGIIIQKTGDDIIIEGGVLTFKSRFFKLGRWNTNILASIEKGVFSIVEKDGKTLLTYQFFMYRLFIISLVSSIIFAIFSGEVWIGIACFLWLGGMNWILAIIRHRKMLNGIIRELDSLLITAIA